MTKQLTSSTKSDTVDALLRDVRVTSTLYCRSTLFAPWGFGVRAHGRAAFHVVTRGSCWLEVDGESERRQLGAGDLVVLPRGSTHWLRDKPDSSAIWLEDLLARHPVDSELRLCTFGRGASTELLCGAFEVEGSRQHPLFSALPAFIHVPAADQASLPGLAATLDLIVDAVSAPGAGATVVLERLSDVLLAQSLRAALTDASDGQSFSLEALRDAGIAPAVRAIHVHPEHGWTLGELSRLTAMSRSAFAARFRALTGESPIRYATRCRLARAARELRGSGSTIASVARHAGYESEFSFGRAFKRAFGIAPGAYRRLHETETIRSASEPQRGSVR